MTEAERFWRRVDRSGGPDSCWLWTGGRYRDGYGQCRAVGKKMANHRAAWVITHGSLPPKGLYVLHNCPGGDKKLCCNPAHLWLGTHADNMADGVKKGQFPRGAECHFNKHPETRPRGEKFQAACRAGAARGERNGMYTHPENRRHGERNPMAKTSDFISKELIPELWRRGKSREYIAQKVGLSEQSVRRHLKKAAALLCGG